MVITVNDRSAKDNFHLVGPGVNRRTSKLGKARVTWKLTLKRGLYTYRSDATPSLRRSSSPVPARGEKSSTSMPFGISTRRSG